MRKIGLEPREGSKAVKRFTPALRARVAFLALFCSPSTRFLRDFWPHASSLVPALLQWRVSHQSPTWDRDSPPRSRDTLNGLDVDEQHLSARHCRRRPHH
eukprot:3975141-Pleurochrysis_carterae.AAC.1